MGTLNKISVSKEVQSLLSKEGFISEIELSNVMESNPNLEDEILFKLLTKVNPLERTKKKSGRSVRNQLSIYLEQNKYMEENKLNSLKGDIKETYFKKKRTNIRKELDSFISSDNVTIEVATSFVNWGKSNFVKFDISDLTTFIGGSKNKVKFLEVKRFVSEVKKFIK